MSPMSDKRSHEQMDNLRERLYARGEEPRARKRTELKSEPAAAPKRGWDDIVPPRPPQSETPAGAEAAPATPLLRNYRSKLILIGLGFFAVSVALSSVYILLGRNTVSGSNISIGITGPFTVGGGEVLPLQVGITNHNQIAIETATLVVQYPPGTRSSEGEGGELFSERIPLSERIGAGETRNISLRPRIFGEENQEQDIKVSIEYRMTGSSATFFKEAEPLRYKIGSAPIVIRVDTDRTISSGQEANVKLTLTSNSPSPIYDLVVRADYPGAFSFTRSDPAPASGRNIWHISEIQPEGSATIDLYGTFAGTASEKYVLRFAAGVASERNPGELASILAAADTEFTLEVPFLSAGITVDGKSEESVTVAPGAQTSISIDVKNTSATPVYDAVVEIRLSGNALVDSQVSVNNGYYDSNTRTVRFDSSSSPRLGRLDPGAAERFSFSLRPEAGNVQSPQVGLELKATGRRVSETSAREEISGTVKRTIRVEGRLLAEGRVADVVGGQVPPTVGRTTEYRIELRVQNSGNPATGAIVTATLPAYVEWVGNGSGGGAWNYNATTRTIEWRAGGVSAGGAISGTFGVSFLPSSSLIGRTPALVENIQLRADDSFTGTVLRASGAPVSAEISGQRGSGTVQSN